MLGKLQVSLEIGPIENERHDSSKNTGLKPSSDEPTHREIYKNSDFVGGIVHTHSQYATAYAQAMLDIENYGTTHSDYAKNPIICTRQLTKDEIQEISNESSKKGILEKPEQTEISKNEKTQVKVS